MITFFVADDVQDAVPGWLDNWGGVIILIAAVCAAIAMLWTKVIWHPRSPIRRITAWVFERIVWEPLSRRRNRWFQNATNEVVTPQLDALKLQIAEVGDRNDRQHFENSDKIEHLSTRVNRLAEQLEARNKIDATVTQLIGKWVMADPGFPRREDITGEHEVVPPEIPDEL